MPDSLPNLLANSGRPIYLVDGLRRIALANGALAEWLELPLTDIVGRLVEYHSEGLGEQGAPLTGLCPPPAALAGEEKQANVSMLNRRGRLRYRRASFHPLATAADSLRDGGCPVLCVVGEHDLSAADLAKQTPVADNDELHHALTELRRQTRGQLPGPLVGASPLAQQLRRQAEAAAAAGCNVLVIGPKGSGRQQVARSIHARTVTVLPRSLCPIDCVALGDNNTLATLDRALELESTTTVLLLSADTLGSSTQQELAKRLAAGSPPPRVLLTCENPPSSPLGALAGVMTLTLPPLAHRLDDLPQLVQWRLEQLNRGSGKQLAGVTSDARELLALYSWPGELTQLCEVLGQAFAQCDGVAIEPRHLPPLLRHSAHAAEHAALPTPTIQLDEFLLEIERDLVERALHTAEGNKAEAARLLGVTRPRLYRALERFDLNPEPPQDAE